MGGGGFDSVCVCIQLKKSVYTHIYVLHRVSSSAFTHLVGDIWLEYL